MWALADCNNFFVSCERVFQPRLEGQAVVVLSNNDGCVIARSNEAKAFGIPMGAPVFEIRDILNKNKIIQFSCNHSLYGDMSRRVMRTLYEFVPSLEVYSIDEAFLPDTDEKTARAARATIRKSVGIPVSFGIATTKTLAKLANHVAKKNPEFGGVFDLAAHPDPDAILGALPVGEIWGIGRRLGPKLEKEGVKTVLDFIRKDDRWLRWKMGVNGVRMAEELRGVESVTMDVQPEMRKSVVSSRSFARPMTSLGDVKKAVAHHAASAAETLRAEGLKASVISVFLGFNRHAYGTGYPLGLSEDLDPPSAFTPDLIKAAERIVERVFIPGGRYKKAGVMCYGIVPDDPLQLGLFGTPDLDPRRKAAMHALDKVNAKWGSGALKMAAEGLTTGWRGKANLRTPRYTSAWEELYRL